MPSNPIVETASGKVRGAANAGIYAFKAIPYGASTAGANRFQPPRPAEPWAGVRDTLALGGRAPQWQAGPTRRPGMATLLGPVDTSPETEDCLSLHVWTPSLDGAKRPVMVWLHGGAFHFGSANRAVTDGANLARRGDVVVVSVNHRLNILGHFDLSGIGGERYAHSGNAGGARIVSPGHHSERCVGPCLNPSTRYGARRGGTTAARCDPRLDRPAGDDPCRAAGGGDHAGKAVRGTG